MGGWLAQRGVGWMLVGYVVVLGLSESWGESRQESADSDHSTPDLADRSFVTWATLTVDTYLKNQSKHIGERITLDCEITGYPTPMYRWFKDEEELARDESGSSNRKYKIQDQDWGSRLRITKAAAEDAGVYRCLAQNPKGSEETSAFLKLKTAPPTAAVPTVAPKKAPTTPEEESDDDDVEPYCQKYKGNYCGFLKEQQIYVTSRKSQHMADNRIMRLLTELSTHSLDSSQCYKRAREATCYYQMPLCAQDMYQRSYPRRLCRDECDALVSLCRSEFKDNVKAWQLLPNCLDLSLNGNCVKMGLAPKMPTAAAPKEENALTQGIDDDLRHMLTIVVPSSVAVVLIIVIVGVVCACKRRRAQKNDQQQANGDRKTQDMSLVSSGEKNLSYVKEVPASNIHMVQELGEGEYGKIYVGQALGLYGSGTSSTVLVKTLREKAPTAVSQSFRKEIDDMVEVRHQHLALLLAVSLNGTPQCSLYEYLPLGDLHQLLVARSSDSVGGGISAPRLATAAPLQLREQMYLATQVASALEYLRSVDRVHGDVAARNVLVGHGLIAKLSNLSITRGIYSADYCSLHGRATPVRWLPAEAITYGKRSHESDAYSFGILLWELFSSAVQQPYSDCSNQDVMGLVRSRQLLSCPHACPPRMYSLMMECWHEAPGKRPTARELHQKLRSWYLDGSGAAAGGPPAPPQSVDWAAGASSATASSGGSSIAPSLHSYSSSASGCVGGVGALSNGTNLTDVRSSGASTAAEQTTASGPYFRNGHPSFGFQNTSQLVALNVVTAASAGQSDVAAGNDTATPAKLLVAGGGSLLQPVYTGSQRKFGDPQLHSSDY